MKRFFTTMLCGAGSMLCAADLYLCGDSIMADYRKRDPRPCYGWGEFIQDHCRGEVHVFDLAVPGASTESFLKRDLWEKALARFQKGDFVFLGFGFNDADADNKVGYCDEKQFERNLLTMASDVRHKGATPLLLTSTECYQETSEKRATHARYNGAVRRTAAQGEIELIDLNAKFLPFIDASPDAARYFILKRQIPIKNWVDYDPTHLSEAGARLAAQMVIDLIQENHLSAKILLKN